MKHISMFWMKSRSNNKRICSLRKIHRIHKSRNANSSRKIRNLQKSDKFNQRKRPRSRRRKFKFEKNFRTKRGLFRNGRRSDVMAEKAKIIDSNSHEEVGRYEAKVTNKKFLYDRIQTHAGKLDNHFLLYENMYGHQNKQQLFGVVDCDKPEEADRRLYERAKDFVRGCEIKDETRHAGKNLEAIAT